MDLGSLFHFLYNGRRVFYTIYAHSPEGDTATALAEFALSECSCLSFVPSRNCTLSRRRPASAIFNVELKLKVVSRSRDMSKYVARYDLFNAYSDLIIDSYDNIMMSAY